MSTYRRPLKLKKMASAVGRAFMLIAGIYIGQSNNQGAAMKWCGPRVTAQIDRHVSSVTGRTDPYPMCNNKNQGGSSIPYLEEELWYEMGIMADFWNCAIGGASIDHYVGRVGGVVNGSATKPVDDGYTSGGEYTIPGGAAYCQPGDVGSDPFGMTSRVVNLILRLRASGAYDAILLFWSQGESDAGKTSADYQAGLTIMTSVMLAAGADAVFLGMTCKTGSGVLAQYQALDAGRAAAVTAFQAANQPVYHDANLLLEWGDRAPLYPEDNGGAYVHLTKRGQQKHARLRRQAIQLALAA